LEPSQRFGISESPGRLQIAITYATMLPSWHFIKNANISLLYKDSSQKTPLMLTTTTSNKTMKHEANLKRSSTC